MENITLESESTLLTQRNARTNPRPKPAKVDETSSRDNADEPALSPPGSPQVGFDVDPNTGQVFIHVIDPESGEIVREIPPEELRRLATVMDEISGKLIDASA